MVEGQPAVVHTEQTLFVAVIDHRHAACDGALLVADGNRPGVHPARCAVGDQLSEDHRQLTVACCVADVVLARGVVRGVQVEHLGIGVVGAGGAQLLHIGPVAGLGHREAAG